MMLALAIMVEWLPVSAAIVVSRYYSDASFFSFQGWEFEILFQSLTLMMATAVALKNRRLPVRFELAAPQIRIWTLQYLAAQGTLLCFSLLARDQTVDLWAAYSISLLFGAYFVRSLVVPESDISLLAASRLKELGTWKEVMKERGRISRKHLKAAISLSMCSVLLAYFVIMGIYRGQEGDHSSGLPWAIYLAVGVLPIILLASFLNWHYRIFLRKAGEEE